MKEARQDANSIKIPLGVLEGLKQSKKAKGDRPSWYEMNWFVEFSKKDLKKLRPGDLLNLQEEFLAHEGPGIFQQRVSPTLDELQITQTVVTRHLLELVERGYTKLGPFEHEDHLVRPRKDMFPDMPDLPESFWKDQKLVDLESVVVETVADEKSPRLVCKFSTLFKEHVAAVRRCPHCSAIFLRFKRNATYCSRKCQSVAFMRLKRAQGDGGSMKNPGRRPKRRSAHGKTKR